MIGRVMWVTWVVYITILPTVICSNQNNHKISGGNDASKNEFPYIARLDIDGELCGASLISEKYLATAAHCICNRCRSASAIKKDFDKKCKNQHNRCVAYIRDHDTTRHDIGEERIDIRKIHLKPGRYIDFLIVELVRSVNLDKRANPIPVSQSAVKIRQKVITAGWGMVAPNTFHPILQTATLEVSYVRNGFVWTKVDYDNNGIPIDPCAGDSGGPLVIREPDGDKLVGALIGYGYDCRDDTTNGDGRWTDVTYHYDWINSVIHSEPLFKKIFAHDTSGGLFTNKDDVLWKNSEDPSAPLFSILGSMSQMKGPFHLKLCYPELPSPNCNEWSQTSNPVTESDITGFIPISIPFTKNSFNKNFGGLGVNSKGHDRYTFIDDVPNHWYWWAAIGAYSYHGGKDTIPGPYLTKVKKVDLYIGHKGSFE